MRQEAVAGVQQVGARCTAAGDPFAEAAALHIVLDHNAPAGQLVLLFGKRLLQSAADLVCLIYLCMDLLFLQQLGCG